MGLLSQKDLDVLRNLFAKELNDPVTLTYYTQGDSPLPVPGTECRYCSDERELLGELTPLSDKLHLETVDFVREADLAHQHGIERIPALELKGHAKGRIRFVGIPSGYEFSSLIEDLVDLSKGTTKLTAATRQALSQLDRPIHIQVFVTPT